MKHYRIEKRTEPILLLLPSLLPDLSSRDPISIILRITLIIIFIINSYLLHLLLAPLVLLHLPSRL